MQKTLIFRFDAGAHLDTQTLNIYVENLSFLLVFKTSLQHYVMHFIVPLTPSPCTSCSPLLQQGSAASDWLNGVPRGQRGGSALSRGCASTRVQRQVGLGEHFSSLQWGPFQASSQC